MFVQRVEELRKLLGLRQDEFVIRVGKSKSVYSQWLRRANKADRDTLIAICSRWHVGLDSLWGSDATVSIEPSPALSVAQSKLITYLGQRGDDLKTATERLILCFDLLTKTETDGGLNLLPSLTLDAWLDWIRWDKESWAEAVAGNIDAGSYQIAGAAMFLGWYDRRAAFVSWIRTGRCSSLAPIADDKALSLGRWLLASGIDEITLRRWKLEYDQGNR